MENKMDSEPATHGDLERLRVELRADFRALAVEIVKTNARIDRLDESFTAKLSEGVSRILKATEDFMAQVQMTDRHQIITGWRIDELEKRVNLLEAR